MLLPSQSCLLRARFICLRTVNNVGNSLLDYSQQEENVLPWLIKTSCKSAGIVMFSQSLLLSRCNEQSVELVNIILAHTNNKDPHALHSVLCTYRD